MSENILTVKDLKTYFYTASGVAKAVDGVSLNIAKGETMRRTSKPVFGASVKGEVRSGNAFSGTCRKPLTFFEDGRNAEPRK